MRKKRMSGGRRRKKVGGAGFWFDVVKLAAKHLPTKKRKVFGGSMKGYGKGKRHCGGHTFVVKTRRVTKRRRGGGLFGGKMGAALRGEYPPKHLRAKKKFSRYDMF